jgi:hypothetical protein
MDSSIVVKDSKASINVVKDFLASQNVVDVLVDS